MFLMSNKYRNNKYMRKTILILVLVLNSSLLFSQGGSNYSALGIGDMNFFGNANYIGTNGVSISLPSNSNISHTNPAMWSGITTTRLQIGYLFNQNIVLDENNSLWQNNGAINGFTSVFSFDSSSGAVGVFGLRPKTDVSYYISTPIEINESGLNLTGFSQYKGFGGLNDLFFGFSYNILPKLSAGISLNYTFGLITRSAQSIFHED